MKAVTNSFQPSISKVYFCEVYPAYAFSKFCEILIQKAKLKQTVIQ